MTQSQLAYKLHVSDGAVSKWERGINFPDIAIVERLSETLEISIMELLKAENQEPDQKVNEAVLDTLNYSKEVESRIIRKSHRSIRLWQVLLVVFIVLGICAKPALNWYQDQASKKLYATILDAVDREDWYTVANVTGDFIGKYYGSSHYAEMKVLNSEASEKFSRHNLGQLMINSTLSTGEIDTLFVLLKKLGFDFYGSVTYFSGDINTKGTLLMGYISSSLKNLGNLVVDYEARKIVRIYIAAPLMDGNIPETDFVLFTDQQGILMTYSDVEVEIQIILDRLNNH